MRRIRQNLLRIQHIHDDYLRSIVFGFQDALVSTTGVIAGVAAGTQDKNLVILAGTITIVVEALSMGAGQYFSEKAVHERASEGSHTDNLFIGAFLMWLSYGLGGLVSLTPIILFPLPVSSMISISFSLVGLFTLGFLKAKLVKVDPLKSALQILLVGGIATTLGVLVGVLLKI